MSPAANDKCCKWLAVTDAPLSLTGTPAPVSQTTRAKQQVSDSKTPNRLWQNVTKQLLERLQVYHEVQ